MKKEQLIELGIDEEVAKKVMDLNGADIEAAKRPLNVKITSLESERDTAIGERDTAVQGLQQFEGLDKKKYDEAIAAVDNLKTQHAAELDRRDTRDKIKSFISDYDKKFINDITRDHYISEIEKALEDKVNKGKNYGDILDGFIKDEKGEVRPGIFKEPDSPNRLIIPPVGGGGPSSGITKEVFNKMGYKERAELHTTNPELYSALAAAKE